MPTKVLGVVGVKGIGRPVEVVMGAGEDEDWLMNEAVPAGRLELWFMNGDGVLVEAVGWGAETGGVGVGCGEGW